MLSWRTRMPAHEGRAVPGLNLTRAEAAERAALLTVDSVDIELDLTRGSQEFGSTTTLRFSAADGASTFVDAVTAGVHTVRLNGEALDPDAVSDGVRITLPRLRAENELVVVADARYTNTGE